MHPDGIPQVIVLNGGSSSGKSSIARSLQEILPGIWLTFGVDTFINSLPDQGDSPRAGITYEQDGTISFTGEHRDLERAWYTGLSSMARSGAHMILDEVLLSGAAGQERLSTPRIAQPKSAHEISPICSGQVPGAGNPLPPRDVD